MKPIGTLLSILIVVSGCSNSLSRRQALAKFKGSPAYRSISHGIQPDGSVTTMRHNADNTPFVGSVGYVQADGETLNSMTVSGIVQEGNHALVHFHIVYDLAPHALQVIRTARTKSGLPNKGNNSVCHIDEAHSLVICDSGWAMTRFDDGWRFDDDTINGGLVTKPGSGE